MKNLLKSVLVIDGNPDSGHGIKRFLLDNNLAKDVAVAHNAWTALNYLKQRLAVGKPLPNLTFVDIDLPHLSAWDFLEKFSNQIGECELHKIYLLSSSNNTKEIIKASLNPLSSGVINKPVTESEIGRIAYDYARRYTQNVA